jgi:RsiW-degrading membrane proteinase PrsW (M82 family)
MAAARRFAWLAILVIGVTLFLLVRSALIVTQNPNFVPSLILIGAAVIPATFVAFIWGRRLSFGVPGTLLAITALVGGVVGVVAAGLLEYNALNDLGTLPTLVVGFSEEIAKLIFPALLLLLPARLYGGKWRIPSHGLVIGVASGAGFAALETMGYAFVFLLATRGNIDATTDVLLLRGLMSPAAHMAWTGLTTAALWWAVSRRWQPKAVLAFLGTFVVSILLHTAWDSFGSNIAYLILSVISLGLLLFAARKLGREEPEPSNQGRTLRTSAV